MIHPGSQETYNTIISQLPENLHWGRMGIVGILGDLAVSSSKGAILEIGMGESTVYLTKLAEKYNRQAFFCDFQASVVLNASTVPGYFGKKYIIRTENEDLDGFAENLVYLGTSDSLFRKYKFPPLALAFLDGDHIYEQVKKDFENILPYLEDTGIILLHDTYPPSEEYTHEARCGTVYKLRQELEKREDLDVITFIRGAMDVGLTVVRRIKENMPEYQR